MRGEPSLTREPADRKSDTIGLRFAVFLIVCLLGVYLAGYVFGSDTGGGSLPGLTGRRFSSVAVARIYRPLAWLEAKLSNKQVHLWVNEPPYGVDDYSYVANP
jgi:hypothetical protein